MINNYEVRLWNEDKKIVFLREGRFKDDEDAFKHIENMPWDIRASYINYAYALSNGLTRNRVDFPEYVKITLTNLSQRVTNIYETINQ